MIRKGSGKSLDVDALRILPLKKRPWMQRASEAFLPEYDDSYATFYVYSLWSASAQVFSSAAGVLSTQSLLMAAGYSSPASTMTGLGVAATINWVLKDGLGQLGGVYFASKFGQTFDSRPRFYRYYSQILLQGSTLLDLVTALLPGWAFLPLASVSNAARNVSWMGTSATRTKTLQQFQIGGNIADLTAKVWSQTVLASTLGTVLGLGLTMCCMRIGLDPIYFNLLCFPPLAYLSVKLTKWSCMLMDASRMSVDRLAQISSRIHNVLSKEIANKNYDHVKGMVPEPETVTWDEDFTSLRPRDTYRDLFPSLAINPEFTEADVQFLQRHKTVVDYLSVGVMFTCEKGGFRVWIRDSTSDECTLCIILNFMYTTMATRERGNLTQEELIRHFAVNLKEQYPFYELLLEQLVSKGWSVADLVPARDRVDYYDYEPGIFEPVDGQSGGEPPRQPKQQRVYLPRERPK